MSLSKVSFDKKEARKVRSVGALEGKSSNRVIVVLCSGRQEASLGGWALKRFGDLVGRHQRISCVRCYHMVLSAYVCQVIVKKMKEKERRSS